MTGERPVLKSILWTFAWFVSFLFFARLLWTPLFDPDLWWHLASGRAMMQNRSLLKTEIFSHTLYGQPWINFEWLGQIIFYEGVKLFGYQFLLFTKIFMGLIAVGLISLSLTLCGTRPSFTLLLSWYSFILVHARLNERIELFSLVLVPLYVFVALLGRKEPKRFFKPALLIFTLLMIFWCNTHGGFIYGIGILVLFYLGSIWSGSVSEKRFFFWAALLSFIASFINPYGPKIFHLYLILANILSGFDRLVLEWGFPQFKHHKPFWTLILIVVIATPLAYQRWKKETRFWLPLVLTFSLWGMVYLRNVALTPFVIIPYLGWVSTRFASRLKPKKLKFIEGTATLLLGLLVGTWSQGKFVPLVSPSNPVTWTKLPAKACLFIESNEIKGTLYNAYEFGGFITWVLGPTHKIFMDGRYLFYRFLEKQYELFQGTDFEKVVGDWKSYFEKYDVNVALVKYLRTRADSPLKDYNPVNLMFPRTDWALVHFDDRALVFLKRGKRHADLIKRLEYKTLWPYNKNQMRNILHDKRVPISQFKKDISRHIRTEGPTEIGQWLLKQVP